MAAIQFDQLRSSVRGAIIQQGDEAYEFARMVYNRMIDKRPALIVRCVDVADVIAAVDYARTNHVLTAIRGGGHNGGGLGTCDGGLVIDLSAIRGVRVDRRHPHRCHRPRRRPWSHRRSRFLWAPPRWGIEPTRLMT